MRKYARLYEMRDFVVGMRVEVASKYSSEILSGTVTKIGTKHESQFIDDKPIRKHVCESVTIEYDQGGQIILDNESILNYAIRRIG